MPAYCAPCPGNMKATGAARLLDCAGPTRLGRGRASARAASAAVAARPRPAGAAKARAADLQRVGHVGQVALRVRAPGARRSSARRRVERGAVRGREQQQLPAAADGGRPARGGASSSTDVGVGAADAERADARAARRRAAAATRVGRALT